MIETITTPGIGLRPWYKKINPIWWFGNDEAPATATFTYKYLRNIAQNFRWYVIGVVDRPHSIKGPQPAMKNLWTDAPPTPGHASGWKWAIVAGFLPYVSYSKGSFAFYLGWQPWGGFGIRVTV